MILTFVAPGAPVPIGGVTMIYEFASAMARRGHEIHLFHYRIFQQEVSRKEDIAWSEFDDSIQHFFPPIIGFDPNTAPPSDIIFGFSEEEKMPRHLGLPVALVQGYRMLRTHVEEQTFHAPCPKICIAKWLVDVGVDLGVPRDELVHIPLGLHHDRYRLTRAMEDRPPRLSFCYNPHPQKGAALAIEVVSRLHELLPEIDVVFFGTGTAGDEVPSWVTYRQHPDQLELVDDIYNRSRVFLCTSDIEGFGLPSIESMAGGAALVTTDNGGADDYAIPGRTALVAPVGHADQLVEHAHSLLCDEPLRLEIARAGREYVQQFDWDRSALLLETFLEEYAEDPVAYGRPPGR